MRLAMKLQWQRRQRLWPQVQEQEINVESFEYQLNVKHTMTRCVVLDWWPRLENSCISRASCSSLTSLELQGALKCRDLVDFSMGFQRSKSRAKNWQTEFNCDLQALSHIWSHHVTSIFDKASRACLRLAGGCAVRKSSIVERSVEAVGVGFSELFSVFCGQPNKK